MSGTARSSASWRRPCRVSTRLSCGRIFGVLLRKGKILQMRFKAMFVTSEKVTNFTSSEATTCRLCLKHNLEPPKQNSEDAFDALPLSLWRFAESLQDIYPPWNMFARSFSETASQQAKISRISSSAGRFRPRDIFLSRYQSVHLVLWSSRRKRSGNKVRQVVAYLENVHVMLQ